MQQLNRNHPLIESAQVFPEKVLMFGESAFLCALVCPALDELNRKGLFGGSVTVAGKNIEHFKTQEGLFTIIEKGIENGGKSIKTNLIICVTDYINPYSDHDNYIKRGRNPELRFIVSDAPDAEKIAALLYERFAFFKGDEKKGLILFSCGRVENNGAELKANVQKYADERGLGKEFKQWMENVCFFANTTADRIVTGFPREDADRIQRKLGYHDELLTICELFYFWAIEAPITVKEELPLDKAGFNIIFNDDITPHHLRKTRLLNGALTCLAPAALLHGYKTVDEAMGNINFKKYLEKALFKEIIPTLDINRNVLDGFAKTVIERLSNPLLKCELLEITQNSTFNFKTQILPTIIEYYKRFGEIPPVLTFSFAALVAFYKSGGRFPLTDNEKNIKFLRDNKLEIILKNISGAWSADFSPVLEKTKFKETVEEHFNIIKKYGVKPLIERFAGK